MRKIIKKSLMGLSIASLSMGNLTTLAQESEGIESLTEYVGDTSAETEPAPSENSGVSPQPEPSASESNEGISDESSKSDDKSSESEFNEYIEVGSGSESDKETKDETEKEIEERYEVKHEAPSESDLNATIEDVIVGYVEKEMAIEYFSGFSRNITTDQFIAEIGESARKIAYENDLFASVMIAQAILESGGGTSGLSNAPYNNLFGIKGVSAWGSVDMGTSEQTSSGEEYHIVATFRAYPSQYESLLDYANLMTKSGLYDGVRKSVSGSTFASVDALQGIYATDISYSAKVKNLIEVYDLTRFDSYSEKGTEELPTPKNTTLYEFRVEVL